MPKGRPPRLAVAIAGLCALAALHIVHLAAAAAQPPLAQAPTTYRGETGQSYMLMSRQRRFLYIKGLIDMMYYWEAVSRSREVGALRQCVEAARLSLIDNRFRGYLSIAQEHWKQNAAALFVTAMQLYCRPSDG